MKKRVFIMNLLSASASLLLCAAMLAGCAAAPKDAEQKDPPAVSAPAEPGSSGPSQPVEPETPAKTDTPTVVPDTPIVPDVPTPEDDTFPTQLQLIADSAKLWALDPDFADDRMGYAVTDLDNNGRLELIAVNQGGTGHYTYASFYEVNSEGTALEPLVYDFPEGDSQPDLMDTDPIPLFWGGQPEAFTYIFRDWLKATAAEYYESLWALTLRDGVITTEPLGAKETVYSTDGETVRYTNHSGAPITEQEYEAMAAATYADRTQHTAAIHWLLFNRGESILSLDADTLLQQLTESCRSSAMTDIPA